MGVRIESTGIFENEGGAVNSTLELIRIASQNCLEKSRYEKNDIGLLLQVSTYKDYNLGEPAFATFVQNDLGINHDKDECVGPRTLSFDLLNGPLGFLNGCQTAGAMIISGQTGTCLVVSGNLMVLRLNKRSSHPPGFCAMGAAMLLDEVKDKETGFSSLFFKSFPEYRDAYDSHLIFEDRKFSLVFRKAPDIEKIYLSAISQTVSEFLEREKADINAFDLILPPQISSGFISGIANLLEVDTNRCIDVTRDDGDLFTASLPAAMNHVLENGLASPDQKALIINVGAGIQVGCATYLF
jgi:3-oxoacyl-[acyl-carrier-protein] synthase III